MKTDRFTEIREAVLSQVFTKDVLINTWRKITKDQLRELDLTDLYDHYDFNYNINIRAQTIRDEILSGDYNASNPLIYKIEKKLGICRHLVVPQPVDCLIMQVITEHIYPKIELIQPSPKAYYSRDRHTKKSVHELGESEYDRNWFRQWKKMQKDILEFNKEHELIATTDITNYYDSIDIILLRETVLGVVDSKDEVLVDLLFRIIESISWKPDYLPHRKKGLPTINLESVRLLAHLFLFDADHVLMNKTKRNFTRWMDDITIGVHTKENAQEILGGLSDVLKSIGLGLNLSKTKLYTSQEYAYDYLFDFNRSLDEYSKIESFSEEQVDELLKLFLLHLNDRSPVQWEKVTKRFITIFRSHRINIISQIENLYIDYPKLRLSIARYLIEVGCNKDTKLALKTILNHLTIQDDISLFFVCRVLTAWKLRDNKSTRSLVDHFTKQISNFKDPYQFYCLLWVKSKYDSPETLLNFIVKYQNNWGKSTFLRRQVSCVLSKLYRYNEKKVLQLLDNQIRSGIPDVVSVASQIKSFAELAEIDFALKAYLFPTRLNRYSEERFNVLCSVLNSPAIVANKENQKLIRRFITDPFHRKHLEKVYSISF